MAGFSVVELKLQMEIGGWGKLLGPLARRVRHNIASLADRNHHLSSFEQACQNIHHRLVVAGRLLRWLGSGSLAR